MKLPKGVALRDHKTARIGYKQPFENTISFFQILMHTRRSVPYDRYSFKTA